MRQIQTQNSGRLAIDSRDVALSQRARHCTDLADLDEAITVKQQVVRLTPDGHPDKPACLSNLRNSFQSRFERLGDLADVDEAITAKQQVVCLTLDGHSDKPGRLNNLGNSF